jgi:NADH-quinone oxidoreductase subunit G
MEKPNTINLKINGKAVTAAAGTSVIQAAAQAGIYIPHYCYHPDLSVAGVCRMCMVEIEKVPRLQVACNTPVTEGMVVQTTTPKVKEAVQGALELHLINHPLDCPICDKAGECKLQDYYVDHGLYKSRMDYDEKVHKPKVQDIGTIVLDSERCILCTRCVRFTAEVTKTFELGIFNRGDRSELRTYDHGPLRNDYTGNLADICPVGALTAKDFRFKQRVWFLDKTETVCAQCAHGCNTTVSVNPTTHKLYRVEPRRNPDVNKSWICDRGRWDFHYVTGDKRIRFPRGRSDGQWVESSWHEVFARCHEQVMQDAAGGLVALSTQLTNEEVTDTVETLQRLGMRQFCWIVDESVVDEKSPFDGILQHHDQTGNATGLQRCVAGMKVNLLRYQQVEKLFKSNAVRWVWALGLEGEALSGAAQFFSLVPPTVKVLAHATSLMPCLEGCVAIVPNVSAFEKSGTMVNAQGRLQRIVPAIPWQYTARDAHAVVFGIDRGTDREISPAGRAQKIFDSGMFRAIYPGIEMKWKQVSPAGVEIGERITP